MPAPPAVAAHHEAIDLPCEYSEVTEGLVTTRRWQARWKDEEAAYVQFIERTTPPAVKPAPEPPTPPKTEDPKPAPEPPVPPKTEDPKPAPEPPTPPKTEDPKPAPTLLVGVESGRLFVRGAKAGESVLIWDVTGKLLGQYRIHTSAENYPLPLAQYFIVRVGKEVFKLSVAN